MSKSQIILLDVDGVLADFVGATLNLLGRQEVFVDRWNFHEQLGMTANELWKKIDAAGHEFWANIPRLPWAHDVLNLLTIHGLGGFVSDVILCTSPSLSDGCNSGKVAWIRKNFPEFSRRFMITPCKYLLRGDFILIDDHDVNVKSFPDGQRTILFPQPWNENREHCHDRIDYLGRKLNEIKHETK